MLGLCPACPDGGGGRGGEWLVLVRFLSPALGHKVLFAHALSSLSGWVDPGIPLLLPTGLRSSSLMTSWVPGSLASCCLFLAVVLGRCNRQGPIQNRHPKARQVFVRQYIDASIRLAPIGDAVICCYYNFLILFRVYFSVCRTNAG